MTQQPPPPPSRFLRANYVLWALIAALFVFVAAARLIPAHWLLGGVVVVLLLTRQRQRRGDSTDPDVHPNARFGDDRPTTATECLWCGTPLAETSNDEFCPVGTDCRDSWYHVVAERYGHDQ